MIADVVDKVQEALNEQALVDVCKLAGIGWAPLANDKGEPEAVLYTHIAYVNADHVFLTIEKRTPTWSTDQPYRSIGTKYDLTLAKMGISLFPGNYDVLVFETCEIHERYRGHGIGSLLHGYRLDAAKAAGASCVVCTVRSDNAAERAILKKFDWHEMRAFVPKYRREDKHVVGVEFWMKEI